MIQSNMPAAYESFTPNYKNGRAIDEFGEKFRFVADRQYEIQPKSAFSIWGNKASVIHWRGLHNFASGAGFQFERVGTNWFLNGELEWYSD